MEHHKPRPLTAMLSNHSSRGAFPAPPLGLTRSDRLQSPTASRHPTSQAIRLLLAAGTITACLLGWIVPFTCMAADPMFHGLAGLTGHAIRTAALADLVTPYRTLRYAGVVGQTDDYTCGPAAVATLLSEYFRIDATEQAVLERVERFMAERGQALGGPISALDLVQTMAVLGLPTRGYRVTADALVDYFRRGGPPVIAHVTRPQRHFVVIVGSVGTNLVLADPSWGRRIEPRAALEEERGFSGVVLVPLTTATQAEEAHRHQARALGEAAAQLAHLRALRETLR